MKKGMKYLCSLKDNRTVTKVSENLCIPKLNLGLTEQHNLCAGRLVFMLLNFARESGIRKGKQPGFIPCAHYVKLR
jgi:hypothetical protein